MSDTEKLISNLQFFVTNLAQQAEGHVIQAKVFGSQGYEKLEKKYLEHAAEERGYVEQFITRILDLGGEVKLEAKTAVPVLTDPVEWIKCDLQVSIDGLKFLKGVIDETKDLTTYDMFKVYYKDEEEDMYWGQQQLDLIKAIGVQNWLVRQL